VSLHKLPETRVPNVDAGHAKGAIAGQDAGEGELGAEPADVGARGDPHLDITDLRRHRVAREEAVEHE
jgi:hypothetical protein